MAGVKFKRLWQEWQGVMIIAPSVALIVIGGTATGIFQLLEWATTDQFFRLRPPEPKDERIVIVTVDESDITYAKNWPMSDRLMAQGLMNIQAQKPRAIGIDIYRDLPVEPGHKDLVDLFKNQDNIFGIGKFGGDSTTPPPPALQEKGQFGAADLSPDADGKIRRGLIVVPDQDKNDHLGLGVVLALHYLRQEDLELQLVDGERFYFGLGQALFKPLSKQSLGYGGNGLGGYNILLNYRGQLGDFDHISLEDVLKNRVPPGLFTDRVVLIGAIASSLKDEFATPYNSYLLKSTSLMPGVVIHANMASHIMAAALDGRAMVEVLTYQQTYGWIFVVTAIAGINCWVVLRHGRLGKNILFSAPLIPLVVELGILALISYGAFFSGLIIPLFSPALAVVICTIIVTNYHSQWQLKQANHQLGQTNQKLAQANNKLEEYSQTLELKVQERTQELAQTLQELRETQSHLIHTEKMTSLGEMVAGVAHEINNPVNFILGNVRPIREYLQDLFELLDVYQNCYPEPEEDITDLLEEIELGYLQEDAFKIINSIHLGAERIELIVKSLATFARLDETGVKPININDNLTSTLTILQHRFQLGNNEQIPVIQDYGDIPLVECHGGEMNQVFMNLLNNAVDSIRDRSDRAPSPLEDCIRVTTTSMGDQVIISIADTGMGIPLAIQDKIFDPFFTTKPVGQGSGLGLTTAHAIVVKQHQGQLEYHSRDGGTEFKIILPIESRELSGAKSDKN